MRLSHSEQKTGNIACFNRHRVSGKLDI